MPAFSANLGFLWRELPLPDAIAAASAAGFDAVECHDPYAFESASVRAALLDTGFEMLSLNTRPGSQAGDFGLASVPGRESEARASIDEAFAYATGIGCPRVHVLAGVNGDRATYLDNLTYAAEQAAASGMVVLIEPLSTGEAPGYHLSRVRDAEAVVDELGVGNVGILFDVFHVRAMGADPFEEFVRTSRHIRHVQIASFPDRGEPTDGEIEFSTLLPAMIAAGYQGAFGAEYRPRDTIESGLSWLDAWR